MYTGTCSTSEFFVEASMFISTYYTFSAGNPKLKISKGLLSTQNLRLIIKCTTYTLMQLHLKIGQY